MAISNKTILLLAVLIVFGIMGHQIHLHRLRHAASGTSVAQASTEAPSPAIPESASTPTTQTPSEPDAVPPELMHPEPPSELSDPADDPSERRRLVNEQAKRMYEYAANAGADDPFSMTQEQIEAFRKRGDPTLW